MAGIDAKDRERINVLEDALRSAKQSGDTETARRAAVAIRAIQARNKPGAGEVFLRGIPRGGGSMVNQAKRIASFANTQPFSEEAMSSRQEIASDEEKARQEYAQLSEGHPVAGFLGQAALPTLLSGGRSIPAAAARGALTGALQYNEDPSMMGVNTLLGGILGGGAQKLAGTTRELGRRASQVGLKSTPEEQGLTFLGRDRVRDMGAYRMEAFKNATFNREQVTRQALTEIGDSGTRFTDDTIANLNTRAKSLLNEAIGSKENILFTKTNGSSPIQFLDDYISLSRKGRVTGGYEKGKKAAAQYAEELKREIAKGNGILPVDRYQSLRSDITEDIIRASSGKKKRELGIMLEWLDDNAKKSLSGETLSKFQRGRQLYKNYIMFKRDGLYDEESGLINPKVISKVLKNKDESGYLLKNNPSRLYEMVRVNNMLAGSKLSGAPQTNANFRASLSPSGQGGISVLANRLLKTPLEKLALSANRLPMDLMTDVPPAFGVTGVNQLSNDQLNLQPLLDYQRNK